MLGIFKIKLMSGNGKCYQILVLKGCVPLDDDPGVYLYVMAGSMLSISPNQLPPTAYDLILIFCKV